MTRTIDILGIRPPFARALLATLSGGNQQKVVIGKWLLMRPTLLVLDDPTEALTAELRAELVAGKGALLMALDLAVGWRQPLQIIHDDQCQVLPL